MVRLIPMVILLLFTGVSLGANLVKHGQKKENEKWNIWTALLGSAINWLLILWATGVVF